MLYGPLFCFKVHLFLYQVTYIVVGYCRDRIKDSCDQLRVLLPYIRGRKTDMASILEMSVDYIKIVNMCMPQTLQDQVRVVSLHIRMEKFTTTN